VIWSDDNRLLVTTLRTEQRTVGNGIYMDTFVERIYTMAPDGSDEREVAWTDATADRIPAWSPDGRWLAVVDSTAGVLTVHEVATGEDTVTAIPVNLTFGAWSPDSDRLMLFGGGDGPDGYSLYVINVDGSGFLPLGDGGDFSWMPASVTGPNEPQ